MALSLRPAGLPCRATATKRKAARLLCARSESVASNAQASIAPVINVEAATPQGTIQLVIPSGEQTLRTAMVKQKVDLYDMWGKVMNCGGGGSCGTCIVEVRGRMVLRMRVHHTCMPHEQACACCRIRTAHCHKRYMSGCINCGTVRGALQH